MEPSLVVGWILLAGGVAILIRGLLLAKLAPFLNQVMHYVTALAFLGIGGFGPSFLIESGLADLLRDLSNNQDIQTYTEYFDSVGSGDVSSGVADAGLALTLEKPVPEMEQALEEAIVRAKNPEGKKRLEITLENLRGKEAVTDGIITGLDSNLLDPQRVMSFDIATRERLAILPEDQLRRYRLNRDALRTPIRRPPPAP